jgi:hypothetical protein
VGTLPSRVGTLLSLSSRVGTLLSCVGTLLSLPSRVGSFLSRVGTLPSRVGTLLCCTGTLLSHISTLLVPLCTSQSSWTPPQYCALLCMGTLLIMCHLRMGTLPMGTHW